jgi:hypothetical protein
MAALFSVIYGLAAYALFQGTLLYAVGFVGNLMVPKSVDVGASAPMLESIVVNVLLLGVFAIQHSAMARPAFKRWWTKIVPSSSRRAWRSCGCIGSGVRSPTSSGTCKVPAASPCCTRCSGSVGWCC